MHELMVVFRTPQLSGGNGDNGIAHLLEHFLCMPVEQPSFTRRWQGLTTDNSIALWTCGGSLNDLKNDLDTLVYNVKNCIKLSSDSISYHMNRIRYESGDYSSSLNFNTQNDSIAESLCSYLTAALSVAEPIICIRDDRGSSYTFLDRVWSRTGCRCVVRHQLVSDTSAREAHIVMYRATSLRELVLWNIHVEAINAACRELELELIRPYSTFVEVLHQDTYRILSPTSDHGNIPLISLIDFKKFVNDTKRRFNNRVIISSINESSIINFYNAIHLKLFIVSGISGYRHLLTDIESALSESECIQFSRQRLANAIVVKSNE